MSETIPGYVRDALPDEQWRESLTPPGFRLVVVDELQRDAGSGWVRLLPGERRNCRYGSGPRHPACGRPAVLGLWRGRYGRKPTLWAYCEEHTYGRVWDGERLLTTVLVREDTA